jgi:hypothetical protein
MHVDGSLDAHYLHVPCVRVGGVDLCLGPGSRACAGFQATSTFRASRAAMSLVPATIGQAASISTRTPPSRECSALRPVFGRRRSAVRLLVHPSARRGPTGP